MKKTVSNISEFHLIDGQIRRALSVFFIIKQALIAKATVECYSNKHKHTSVRDVLVDTLERPIVIFYS